MKYLRLIWRNVFRKKTRMFLTTASIILVLVLTGFRQAVFHAVPAQLKIAISVGIGLFIALIGLVDAGFVAGVLTDLVVAYGGG